jgi:hypothetical protein
MSHACIAVASSAMTAFILIPPTEGGGYHFGIFCLFCAALIGAGVTYAMEKE